MRKLNSYTPSLIVLGTAIVVLLAGPRAVWHLTYAQTSARIIQASEGLNHNPILEQLSQAYRDVVTIVEPSVVHISTERTIRNRLGPDRHISSSGSGWVYDEEGYIVTNYHVIEDAEQIDVQLHTGRIREAKIIGYDQFTDIAVIKIEPGLLFPAMRAEPDDFGGPVVRQGDVVFAFGSPFDFRFSVSSGVVSGIGRWVGVIRDERGRLTGYENFIQVDAAINPGNSGGPLTDTRGRIIGMNTAIATGRGSSLDEGQFAGIGLAIPIDMIEPVVEQVISTGSVKKGFLGVEVVDRDQTIGEELARNGFRGYGLIVGRIDPNNPAFEAGLRLGDVITQVNAEPVATLTQIGRAVSGVEPDDSVALSVRRYDEATDTNDRIRIELPGVVATNNFRGVSLLELNDDINDWLAVLGYTGGGVRVTGVELDKPARRAGLRSRDVITHVNDVPVMSTQQLRSRISSMRPGEMAHVKVWRFEPERDKGREVTFHVRLDRFDEMRRTGVIPKDLQMDSLQRLGLARVATNTLALAAEYGVRYSPGVLVQEVVTGSTLDGLMQPGSVIIAVMDRMVTDVDDFFSLLEQYDVRSDVGGVRVTFISPAGRRVDTHLRLQ